MDPHHKQIIIRQSNTIAILFVIILILFVVICFISTSRYEISGRSTNENSGIASSPVFCGNAVRDDQNSARANAEFGLNGNSNHGSKLFKQNCAVCHALSDQKVVGPGLFGIYGRVPQPTMTWLKNYILNNEKLYRTGDAYAKKLRRHYPKDRMSIFEGMLTDEDLNDLIIYIIGNSKY